MSKDKGDIIITMEEIDRRIEEMDTLDLRDPKERKQTTIDIDEIVRSLDLESKLPSSIEPTTNVESTNENQEDTD